MALSTIPYSGVNMILKIDSDEITNVRSVSVEVDDGLLAVPADNTSSGWTSYVRSERAWRARVDCNDIPAEYSSVAALGIAATTGTMSFYPNGSASGDELISGPCLVGFPTKTAGADGVVSYTFGIAGMGALTIGTQTV